MRPTSPGESWVFDLNDFFYFAKIVENGSLSATATSLGVAKSKVSEHLARLESCLDVRLIERTTRRLEVTAIGLRFYEHCRAMIEDAELAQQVIEETRTNPGGTVRAACTMLFGQAIIGPLLGEFLREHPETQVLLDVTNAPVDVLGSNYDLVFRVTQETRDSSLVVRTLAEVQPVLCASREFAQRCTLPSEPEQLVGFDTFGPAMERTRYQWSLMHENGETRTIALRPRLVSHSAWVLLEALLSGDGIGMLPSFLRHSPHRAHALVDVLPEWRPAKWSYQVVYASRNGLSAASRAFLEYLIERMPMATGDQSMSLQLAPVAA